MHEEVNVQPFAGAVEGQGPLPFERPDPTQDGFQAHPGLILAPDPHRLIRVQLPLGTTWATFFESLLARSAGVAGALEAATQAAQVGPGGDLGHALAGVRLNPGGHLAGRPHPPVGRTRWQGPPEGLLLLLVQQGPLIPSWVVAVLIDEPLGSLGVVAPDELVEPVLAKPGGLAHCPGLLYNQITCQRVFSLASWQLR